MLVKLSTLGVTFYHKIVIQNLVKHFLSSVFDLIFNVSRQTNAPVLVLFYTDSFGSQSFPIKFNYTIISFSHQARAVWLCVNVINRLKLFFQLCNYRQYFFEIITCYKIVSHQLRVNKSWKMRRVTLFSLLSFILTLFITFPVWRRHLKTKSHRKEKNPNKKDWGSWLVHGPGFEFNKTFYGFFNF